MYASFLSFLSFPSPFFTSSLLPSFSQAPDALILMGPFIDASHPQIAAGDVALDDGAGGKVEVDFKELFRLRVLMLLEQHLPDLTTKVILIPSLDDVHHDDYVFPQPALPIRQPPLVKQLQERVPDSRMSLFHLVKQHHRPGTPPHRLC